MPPRGNRLACTLRSTDGAQGSFDVYPGEMGMTGQVILVNSYQWKALTDAKLEQFFFGAILWGRSPFKVIEDAQTMLKRGK